MHIKVPENIEIQKEILDLVNGNRILANILWNRGYRTAEDVRKFLHPAYYQATSPSTLPGMNEALGILIPAIISGKKICVYGDYDVDGVTSTSLLVMTLKSLGADVVYHVPNRFTEGYGLNQEVVKNLVQQDCQVILTCDCGISNYAEIALAKELGLKVIVTDHHSLPEVMVPADAIINPKLLPEKHPCRELPGVGVAYMLARALGEKFGHINYAKLLQLVAFGTIADVVPLVGENRFHLQLGLESLRSDNIINGIKALLKVCHITEVDEEVIAFHLAPRLNAPGRIDSAEICVRLLLSDNQEEALFLARAIDDKNNQRRLLVESVMADLQNLSPEGSVVLFNEKWHQGIIGIVAGRLADSLKVPVVLMTLKSDRCTVTGSARSIEGVNIYDCLARVHYYLDNYGGHELAAGFSLSKEKLDEFMADLKKEIDQNLTYAKPKPVTVDAQITFDMINSGIYEQIRMLAPFGEGNPAPLFFTPGVKIETWRNIGKGEHKRLTLSQYAVAHTAVWWWNNSTPEIGSVVDAIYTLNCNSYNGNKTIQLVIHDLVKAEITPESIHRLPETNVPEIEIIDARYFPGMFAPITITEDVCYYAEGRKTEAHEMNRYSISKCKTLILKTIPPHLRVLKEMIALAQCSKLVLFYPNKVSDEPFLIRLMSILKSLANKEKITTLEYLAAATGELEITVIMGLRVLRESGYIIWESEGTRIQFSLRNGEKISTKSQNFKKMLQAERETKAFKEFMISSSIEIIRKTL